MIEQGEQSMTIWDWLLDFGGCNSNREVRERLLSQSGGMVEQRYFETEKQYFHIEPNQVDHTLHRYSDTLFAYLCTIFPEQKVKEAYDLYQVGSVSDKTIFWYQNFSEQYCFDKIMTYQSDGHRNKHVKPERKYLVRDGYTDRCFFGEHLIGSWKKKHYVVESEKTALIGWLHYSIPFIASGGSSCLSMIGSGSILLPDYDKAGESWREWGKISEWWNNFKGIEINIGDDIGDAIIKKKNYEQTRTRIKI